MEHRGEVNNLIVFSETQHSINALFNSYGVFRLQVHIKSEIINAHLLTWGWVFILFWICLEFIIWFKLNFQHDFTLAPSAIKLARDVPCINLMVKEWSLKIAYRTLYFFSLIHIAHKLCSEQISTISSGHVK